MAASATRRRDIEMKEREAVRNRWSAPLVIAILTAAAAGLGNAAAIVMNGIEQRKLETTKFEQAKAIEETKAEAARIFEVIKTGNAKQAATNLKFLVDVGLISDSNRRQSIKTLHERGTELPALPRPLNLDDPALRVNVNDPLTPSLKNSQTRQKP